MGFIRRLFKRECKHEYRMTDTSNAIGYDGMGYPLRLNLYKCTKCGKYEQRWVDSVKDPNDVIVKWLEVK